MDFNKIIDRSNSKAVKLELKRVLFKTEDVIPLWVADMDFAVADEIQQALKDRIEHPIFGYTHQGSEFFDAIVNWQQKRHNWEVSARSISVVSGVIPALALSIQAFTNIGDKIMIQPPVYPPFFELVEKSGRELVRNSLLNNNGEYSIDFDDMEKSFADGVKLIILNNPHNPVGKVWTRIELEKLVELCVKYDVKILSDEIHSDLITSDKPHIPVASISKEASNITITCMAPTKTFNIAGLAVAYTIITDNKLRKAYRKELNLLHLSLGNTFGTEALIAGYSYGEEWLNSALTYIKSNISYVSGYLKMNIPQVTMAKNEGTYLLWLDFRGLNLSQQELKKFLIEKAKIGLNQGSEFGEEGSGFARLNTATPRVILEKAMEQLKNAVDELK